mmetsp:Transcript_10402/g.12821  ORF Transcript_10402/g.12821 Transcript_10402/m.12821 type:complete len:229 (-) Transcript_10402:34-720(-)
MEVWVEVSIYFVTLTILGVNLARVNPKKPYMSFFATSVMAIGSVMHYFAQTYDLSHETLAEPWHDPTTQSLALFAFAYMFADLPVLMFFGQMETYERVMFIIHHMVSAVQLGSSLYCNKYQRLVLFFITAEATNILLNLRKIIPQTGPLKLIIDAMFAVSFLGYRMCYLFPILVRTIVILALAQEWFDLFVINCGALFVGILHIWWTYLILKGIYEIIVPPKKKEKAE